MQGSWGNAMMSGGVRVRNGGISGDGPDGGRPGAHGAMSRRPRTGSASGSSEMTRNPGHRQQPTGPQPRRGGLLGERGKRRLHHDNLHRFVERVEGRRGQLWLKKAERGKAPGLGGPGVASVVSSMPARSGHPFFTADRAHPDDVFSYVIAGFLVGESGRHRPRGGGLQRDHPAGTPSGAYVGRGDAWLGKQDADKAIADFNQAIQLDPKAPGRISIGGTPGWKSRMPTRPSPTSTRPSGSTRTSPGVHRPRHLWQLKEEYDKAIADLDQAIRLESERRRGPRRPRPCLERRGSTTRRSPTRPGHPARTRDHA